MGSKRLRFVPSPQLRLPAVIRQAAPLPSLENRSQSLAYPDTAATPLGRAIGPIAAAAHPRLTGLLPAARSARSLCRKSAPCKAGNAEPRRAVLHLA